MKKYWNHDNIKNIAIYRICFPNFLLNIPFRKFHFSQFSSLIEIFLNYHCANGILLIFDLTMGIVIRKIFVYLGKNIGIMIILKT